MRWATARIPLAVLGISVVVLGLSGAGAAFLIHRGVALRGVTLQARHVKVGFARVDFEALRLDAGRFHAEFKTLVIRYENGVWQVEGPLLELQTLAPADDAEPVAESTHGQGRRAVRVNLGVVHWRATNGPDNAPDNAPDSGPENAREKRAETGTENVQSATFHRVSLERTESGALRVGAGEGTLERGAVTASLSDIAGERDAAGAWNVAVGEARVRIRAEERKSHPVPGAAEGSDGLDVVMASVDALVLRGDAALFAGLRRIPMAHAAVKMLRLEEVAAIPGAQFVVEKCEFTRDHAGLRAHAEIAGDGLPQVADVSLDDAGETLVIDARGGPIRLGLEGARQGEVALTARVEFRTRRRELDARGSLRVAGFPVKRAWLGSEGFDVDGAVSGHFSFSGFGPVRLDDGAFELGRVRPLRGQISLSGDWRQGRVDGDVNVDSMPCNDAVSSLPIPFRAVLGQLRFEGKKGVTGTLSANIVDPASARLHVRETGNCTAIAAPKHLSPAAFDEAFTLTVFDEARLPHAQEFGPGTDSWRPIGRVSRAFLAGVLTTEDAGFFRHKGVSWMAIQSALVDDLRARRFLRGGSTITMQLVKNLFLSRQKNLARKLEEVLLTDYLEDAFGKERILELYANIVELGPDIFGVEAGAQHHFGVGAEELSVLEGFWLATLLPNPKERGHVAADGTISRGKLQELRGLVKKAVAHGFLTEEDATEADEAGLHFPRLAGGASRVPGLGLVAPAARAEGKPIEGP